MNGFLKKFLVSLVLLTVLLTNGLHVAALKGYAWTVMFIEYNETLDVADAFEATFSGRELCGICLASQRLQDDLDSALGDFLAMGSPLLALMLASIVLARRSAQIGRNPITFGHHRIQGRKSLLDPPPPRILAY